MDTVGIRQVNALERSDADCLLGLLRACAWAPPGSDDSAVGVNYQKAVSAVKESAVWKKNVHVQNWLTSNWLNHPRVMPANKGIFLLG